MIQSLRRTHWRLMLVLVLLLPTVVVAGLMARPTFLRMAPLPEESPLIYALPRLEKWDQVGLEVGFKRPAKPTERAVMCVLPREESHEPDLLMYWNPSVIQSGERAGERVGEPGDGSVLLGSLKGRQTRCVNIPIEVPESSGSLVIYSLAHRKQIASTSWRVTFADEGAR